MKKLLIAIVAVVIVVVALLEFGGPIFSMFGNPSVKIAEAFRQTFSSQSGSMSIDAKINQDSNTYDANLKLGYTRSDDNKTILTYISGSADIMGTAFNGEGWVNRDVNNPSKNVAIFNIPLLSDKYYASVLSQPSDDATTAATQQKALIDSATKNFPSIKWSKKGYAYSASIAATDVSSFYQNLLTDLANDPSFSEYKEQLSGALNSAQNLMGTIGTEQLEVSVTLSADQKSVSTIQIGNANANNTTIAIDFSQMGIAQNITMPSVDSNNSIYIGSSDSSVILYVDGKKADFTGHLEGYTLMLPARNLIESLGGQMTYNEDENGAKTVTGQLENTTIVLDLSSSTAIVNGTPQELAVPPENNDGTIYLPARFIVESLGKTISTEKNVIGQTLVYISN